MVVGYALYHDYIHSKMVTMQQTGAVISVNTAGSVDLLQCISKVMVCCVVSFVVLASR